MYLFSGKELYLSRGYFKKGCISPEDTSSRVTSLK
jgi:hypothetical protein